MSTPNTPKQQTNGKPPVKSELDLIRELTPLPMPVWMCVLTQLFYFGVIFGFTFWAWMPRR